MLTSAATDELLQALADPMRAWIIELLAVEQLCVCHLVEATGAKQPNVSGHLRLLRQLGAVAAEPAGRRADSPITCCARRRWRRCRRTKRRWLSGRGPRRR